MARHNRLAALLLLRLHADRGLFVVAVVDHCADGTDQGRTDPVSPGLDLRPRVPRLPRRTAQWMHSTLLSFQYRHPSRWCWAASPGAPRPSSCMTGAFPARACSPASILAPIVVPLIVLALGEYLSLALAATATWKLGRHRRWFMPCWSRHTSSFRCRPALDRRSQSGADPFRSQPGGGTAGGVPGNVQTGW